MWLNVRPARVAVFVPAIPNWQFHCARKSLEVLTRTWGGAADILIPLGNDRTIPDCFWPIIDAFDADKYAIYCPTFRDFEEAAPSYFAKHRDNQIASMVKSGIKAKRAQENVKSDEFLDSPIFDLELPRPITERLIRDFSPTDGDGPFHVSWFQRDQGPFYGLTDMASFAGIDRDSLTSLDLSGLDPAISLMVADRVGLVGPSYEKILKDHGRVVDRHKVDPTDLPQIIELVSRGYAEPENRALQHRIAKTSPHSKEPSWSGIKHMARFPLNRTDFACDWRVGPIEHLHKQPMIAILGDTVQDFCLASALQRVTGRSVWIPLALIEKNDQAKRSVWRHFLLELQRSKRDTYEDSAIIFSSISLEQTDVEAIRVDAQTYLPDFRQPATKICLPGAIPILARRRLFHKQLNNLVRYEPFIDGEMVATVDTPIPRDCAEHAPQAVTWYVDVHIKNHQLPTRSCTNALVTSASSKGHGVRCSSIGVSYFSQSIFTHSGVRVEENTQRPRLRCPDPKEVFQRLLERDGHRAELSSAGKYLKACIKRFGSLADFAMVLSDDKRNRILNRYVAVKPTSTSNVEVSESDVKVPVWLKDTGRSYLTLEGISDAFGSSTKVARELVDDWLGRGILSRGLILQCPECRYAGWYSIADVDERFRCNRCRELSRIIQETWKDPDTEPWWYYELAEVVYQAVKENCRAPVLALNLLAQGARSYLYTPELDVFFEDKTKTELDLWAIINGRIVIGEATVESQLASSKSKEATRLSLRRRVADATTADEIVFATTAEKWQPATKSRMDAAFYGAKTKVRVIEGLGGTSGDQG